MFLENIPLLSELNTFSIVVRIVLALILGGLLGLERERKQRPAGFRTYLVVCLGSTLAAITNVYMCDAMGSSDPARIPAQVISGIGFLGAGTILVTRNNHIKGLTTAAGLWCCATIGIAVGSGFYIGAIVGGLVLIATLWLLSFVDKRLSRFNRTLRVYAECDQGPFLRSLITYCKKLDYKLDDLEFYPSNNSETSYCTFTIKVKNPNDRNTVITDISGMEGAVLVDNISDD